MSQVFLRDLSPGQAYALQFRSNDGAGNTSDWSQVQRFTTTADTEPPGDVSNLSFYTAGKSFIAQWDPVIHNADGTTLRDFRYYHLHFTSIDASGAADFYSVQPYFELSEAQNIAAFGAFQSNMSVAVTAVDMMYNESVHPATATKDASAPPVPNAPVVGNYLGLLLVTWDGTSNTGSAMPTNLLYAEVHVSTVSGFTPSNSTFAARLFADGSGNKVTIPGLTYGTTYYVRLIAVNTLLKRSGPSVQASGIPLRITGLDIQNGQISAEQINWQATGIPGGNAFYQTSQPTSGMVNGDIWYDTDNAYTTYRYNGTTWVAAPDVGFIPASKLIAGTITANAIGANQIITASANIADAVIDDAKISDLSVAKLTAGSIQANQYVAAGLETDNHAEMNSTGFYVYSQSPSWNGTTDLSLVQSVKMGTGNGDTFSIPDPNNQASSLASISSGGVGSFTTVTSQNDPVFEGVALSDTLAALSGGIVGRFIQTPSPSIGPIRTPYGICEVDADLLPGRAYRISWRADWDTETAGDECRFRIKYTTDGTAPTISSPNLQTWYRTAWSSGRWLTESGTYLLIPNAAATYKFLLTAELGPGTGSIYILASNNVELTIEDVGTTDGSSVGAWSGGGGTLYSGSTATPPPPYVPKNYYWTGGSNWTRSYKSNGGWMTNDGGRAYQGLDPSGYNGNQYSHIGWTTNFASMLSGASNIKVHLVLNYAHWYYNSGGTAVIGRHSNASDPGGGNSSGGTYNVAGTSGLTGWPNPGTREIDITSWALSSLQNGTMHGVTLGPGPSSSYTYYGYANSASLKIWYTK